MAKKTLSLECAPCDTSIITTYQANLHAEIVIVIRKWWQMLIFAWLNKHVGTRSSSRRTESSSFFSSNGGRLVNRKKNIQKFN